MPYVVTEFQPTPNPNAFKCILDRPMPGPIRSFRSLEQAGDDPLARALLALPGVTSVLLAGTGGSGATGGAGNAAGWLTVNKSPGAAWPAVKKGVQEVLSRCE